MICPKHLSLTFGNCRIKGIFLGLEFSMIHGMFEYNLYGKNNSYLFFIRGTE